VKKILLILILIIVGAQTSSAQIKTQTPVPPKNNLIAAVYDSTVNYLKKDFKNYLGVTLYFPSVPDGEENIIYHSVASNFPVYDRSFNHWVDYKKYLADKYFKVVDVSDETSNSDIIAVLKIKDKSNDSTYFIYYNSQETFQSYFIVQEYYEKLKKQAKGKSFYARGRNWLDIEKVPTDFYTGNPVKFYSGQKWTVDDVIIVPSSLPPAIDYLLKNELKESIYMPIEYAISHWVFSNREYNELKSQCSPDQLKLIVAGKISLGMTKKQCIFSWGEPSKINRTVTHLVIHEQWVYESNYLYFDNGILTTMQ
jgi:hypothetical protein